ncbi:RHS repeat-associated core domain-containing protein [Streptomyces sp. CA-132043]|uniref:RHS repeat-associated core domain-containing protein n=1 Tax=Streptomyces sp. CA-132043 TaxID=3240048 RepID=UPI003D9395F1
MTATDPDKGTTTTTYDALDQVTSTTDAEKRTLLFAYDELGRKTGTWQNTKTDANKLSAWSYDSLAKGQPTAATRYDGGTGGKAYTQEVTDYDSLYQPTENRLTLPADDPLVQAGVPKTLTTTTGYRLDGTVSQNSQPAAGGLPAETLSYTYNATGQQLTAKGTTGYLQNAAYAPTGDLRQLSLGTSATTSAKKAYLNYDYEPGTRRLTRSYVTDDVHPYMLQELKFRQDDAGNITSLSDATTLGGTGKSDNQCFAYDGYRRLTEAWTPKTDDCTTTGRTTANLGGAAPYWTSYAYNTAGQRTKQTQHTTTGDTTTTYTYGTDTQPHPLTSTTTGSTTQPYTYDKTGNTTHRPGTAAIQTLTWNTEGDLTTATEPAAQDKPATSTGYLYDADGELLIRRTPGDGESVLYLGATEIHLTVKNGAKTLSGLRYYTAADQTIALRTATSGTSGSKLSFLAGDHHATASLALDASTLAYIKRYITPFGAPRGTKATAWPDDKAFLGKPADAATGLTHIGAREYDPLTATFLSVDPLLETDKAQTLNGYSYAGNSPLTFSDPSGMGLACGQGNFPSCGNGNVTHADGSRSKNGRPTGGGVAPHWRLPGGYGGGGSAHTGGTAHSSSNGHASSKPAAMPQWLSGPIDTIVNYGTALFTPDVIFGAGETFLGAWMMAAGVGGDVAGGVVCLTVVGCVAGAPAIAASTALIVGGAVAGVDGVSRFSRGWVRPSGRRRKEQADLSRRRRGVFLQPER